MHNRGSEIGPHLAQTLLFYAPATGGAPSFPANWTLIESLSALVAGQEGSNLLVFNWAAPADLPPHTCMIAIVDHEADPYPPHAGHPSSWVRNSNNVGWKNLHVVTVPEIESDISNDVREVVPAVVRIDALDLPVNTLFTFIFDPSDLALAPFPPDGFQMNLDYQAAGEYGFTKQNTEQSRFSHRADLPAGAPEAPFRCPFVLRVQLPGGTPAGEVYVLSVDVYQRLPDDDDPDSDEELGLILGGNTYDVSFD